MGRSGKSEGPQSLDRIRRGEIMGDRLHVFAEIGMLRLLGYDQEPIQWASGTLAEGTRLDGANTIPTFAKNRRKLVLRVDSHVCA